jgi:hypothetical protein
MRDAAGSPDEEAAMQLAAGQQWTYRAPEGFEASRLVVGAIVTFAEREAIACCAVLGAPSRQPDGSVAAATIPFLPLAVGALARSVVEPDGAGTLPDGFAEALAAWQEDPRGLASFTVPFEGFLDQMIARQMAEIIGVDPDAPA